MQRLLLCALILVLFAPSLGAQNSYMDFEKGLNLTGPQRAQVEEIKRRYIQEWRILNNQSIRKRIELRETGRDPALRERAERIQRELDAIEIAKANLYNQYRAEVARVLNHEQKGQYDRFFNGERRSPSVRFPHFREHQR